MKLKRDRFGPVTYLMVAALLVCSLFIGAPGAQNAELDTGPQLVDVFLSPSVHVVAAVFESIVGVAVGQELLESYCIENAAAVEIPPVARDTAEHARYESGHRSGVGMCSLAITGYDLDFTLMTRGGGLASPLRI